MPKPKLDTDNEKATYLPTYVANNVSSPAPQKVNSTTGKLPTTTKEVKTVTPTTAKPKTTAVKDKPVITDKPTETTPVTPQETPQEAIPVAETPQVDYTTQLDPNYGIDPAMREAYMTPYAESPEVLQARAYLDEQLDRIKSGKTAYTERLDELINEYLNRDKFEYDPYSDTLFQNALSGAMNAGKQAMSDTIGQASALTGGYGSTYATGAANGAYNQMIQNAYDNLPEYYNMALNQYQMEGQNMLSGIGLVQGQDEREWGRNVDAYNAGANMYDMLYQADRQKYEDTQRQTENLMALDNQNYWSSVEQGNADRSFNESVRQYNTDDAFRKAEAERDQQNWQTSFDEGVRQYEQDFAEGVRQYDNNFAEEQRQFDANLAETKRQHDNSNAVSWANYNLSKDKFEYDKMMDAIELATPKGNGTNGDTSELKKFDYTDIKSARDAGEIDQATFMNTIMDKYNVTGSQIDKGVEAMVKGYSGRWGDAALDAYVRTYFPSLPEDAQADIAEYIMDVAEGNPMVSVATSGGDAYKYMYKDMVSKGLIK